MAGSFSAGGGPGFGGFDAIRAPAARTAVPAAATRRSARAAASGHASRSACEQRTGIVHGHGFFIGTTISSTRLSAGSQNAAAAWMSDGGQRTVARQVLVEVVGIPGGEVVRVQLVALAAEPADALHPAVERRLDLVDRALELARRRRRLLQLRELLVDDRADAIDERLRRRARIGGPRRDDDLELRVERRRTPGTRSRPARSAGRRRGACRAASSCRRRAPARRRRAPRRPGCASGGVSHGEVEARQLHAVLDRLPLHAGQLRVRVVDRRDRRRCPA